MILLLLLVSFIEFFENLNNDQNDENNLFTVIPTEGLEYKFYDYKQNYHITEIYNVNELEIIIYSIYSGYPVNYIEKNTFSNYSSLINYFVVNSKPSILDILNNKINNIIQNVLISFLSSFLFHVNNERVNYIYDI